MDDLAFDRWCPMLDVVGVSVEYRLAPETPYPGPLEDCYAGLKWVYEHAKESGSTATGSACGVSAGGGLAAVSLLARDPGRGSARLRAPRLPDARRPLADLVEPAGRVGRVEQAVQPVRVAVVPRRPRRHRRRPLLRGAGARPTSPGCLPRSCPWAPSTAFGTRTSTTRCGSIRPACHVSCTCIPAHHTATRSRPSPPSPARGVETPTSGSSGSWRSSSACRRSFRGHHANAAQRAPRPWRRASRSRGWRSQALSTRRGSADPVAARCPSGGSCSSICTGARTSGPQPSSPPAHVRKSLATTCGSVPTSSRLFTGATGPLKPAIRPSTRRGCPSRMRCAARRRGRRGAARARAWRSVRRSTARGGRRGDRSAHGRFSLVALNAIHRPSDVS